MFVCCLPTQTFQAGSVGKKIFLLTKKTPFPDKIALNTSIKKIFTKNMIIKTLFG